MSGPLRGVGKTALGVAMVRGHESRRADRLFDDPYAQAFADAAPEAFAGESMAYTACTTPAEAGAGTARPAGGPGAALGAMFASHVVIRTRFFDDHLTAAAAAGCRQVVLLAAGLDTRAFRLDWPMGVRLFEIDLPEVLAFKDTVLAGCGAAPRCERAALPVDLRDDWPGALTEAGFDHAVPTAWLAEGLLLYLTAGEAAALLSGAGELSAPGSRIAVEQGATGHGHGTSLASVRDLPAMEEYVSLWKGGLDADVADWLGGHGWRPRRHDLTSIAASLGRPLPGPDGGGFVTAVRTG
ncbi:SAM-dependent methyltransferase [Microbispora sp. NPDC049125]|uniref:SAM-dependent methyltransferase n=1 Tax=Microbispora sp. NPDC049125 TaxID=3154929 RepID=UPI0034657171